MNTKRIVSILVFVGGLSIASSAQASVNWSIVGTAPGEPDLFGQVTTPDIPVNCTSSPPICNVSGTLTIPAGALGGPGTTIDLLVDPATVTVSISTSPPSGDDNFNLFGITVDGYTCNGITSLTLQCAFNSTTVDFALELAPPSVTIGNGNVLITGQFLANGQPINLTPKQYAIGDEGPAGGIVFYIIPGGQHGLEAALEDQIGGTSIQWGCVGTDLAGAERTYVGGGYANTHDILGGCATRPIAASVAADYTGPTGDTSDWFLPTKDELNLMYENKDMIGDFATDTSLYYRSSSEYNHNNAWRQHFDDGAQAASPKNIGYRVRAVRAF